MHTLVGQSSKATCEPWSQVIFSKHPELNSKVKTWSGSLLKLNVEVLIYRLAHNDLLTEFLMKSLQVTKSGFQCRVLKGAIQGNYCNLLLSVPCPNTPFDILLHPNLAFLINKGYSKEAAVSICYQNFLRLTVQMRYRSIALPVLLGHGEPDFEQYLRILLHSVRQFLEINDDSLDYVYIYVTETQRSLLAKWMPIFFPRTESEAQVSARKLRCVNDDNSIRGFEVGVDVLQILNDEPVIQKHAEHHPSRALANYTANLLNLPYGAYIDGLEEAIELKYLAEVKYTRLVQKARERVQEFTSFNFLRICGRDLFRRSIIALIASDLPSDDQFNETQMTLYVISVIAHVVKQPYICVFFQTNVKKERHQAMKFLANLFKSILNYCCTETLLALIFVIPSVRDRLWTRAYMWATMRPLWCRSLFCTDYKQLLKELGVPCLNIHNDVYEVIH